MKKGLVKIIGGIGSYTAPDGKLVKGVDLIDVIAQVKSQGEVDGYNVIVKSMGGLVEVGYDIYNYLRGLKKPITTIIDKQSASIATVVSLSGDKGQRLIIEGSEFFIHNPWITQSGTADQLAETSTNIRETEKDLVAFYAENTGITKEGIAPLMRNETALTPDEALKLGFVDQIITAEQAKAMGVEVSTSAVLGQAFALLTQTQNKNSNEMKDLTGIKATLSAIAKKIGIKAETETTVVAIDLTTSDTQIVVSFESAGDVPMVGDNAMVEGSPAPDGTYNFENGLVVVVANGVVESVVEAVVEETPEALKAKIKSLEDANKALEAKNKANEYELAKLSVTVEKIGKHITTNYKAPQGGVQGNRGEQSNKVKTIADNTYLKDRVANAKAKIKERNEKK